MDPCALYFDQITCKGSGGEDEYGYQFLCRRHEACLEFCFSFNVRKSGTTRYFFCCFTTNTGEYHDPGIMAIKSRILIYLR